MFCITRKRFLDKELSLPQLSAITDMLRGWFTQRAKRAMSSEGQCQCEAVIYAIARNDLAQIHARLHAALPLATFDSSDPDELIVSSDWMSTNRNSDLSVWREVLRDPEVQGGCVMLRFTIEGRVPSSNARIGTAHQAIVFCGSALIGGDGLICKGIWPVDQNEEAMHMIFRAAPWTDEGSFVSAAELFMSLSASGDEQAAVKQSLRAFRGGRRGHGPLFLSQRQHFLAMTLTRMIVELPDDRSPIGFIRRVITPLALAALLTGIAFVQRKSLPLFCLFLILAVGFILVSLRIVIKKVLHVRRYYQRMRAGLGKVHSAPIEYRQVDLSSDMTPTRVKYSMDLGALGAKHICDVSIATAKATFDGNRIYSIGPNTSLGLLMLRNADQFLFFPPKPIFLLKTSFQGGRIHQTVNQPRYRKNSTDLHSGRCVLDEDNVQIVLHQHENDVNRLIAQGLVPKRPPANVAEVMKELKEDHEFSRQAWQKSAYSWGDAVYESFKVCRGEFLRDPK
jgi:hypothetical protein